MVDYDVEVYESPTGVVRNVVGSVNGTPSYVILTTGSGVEEKSRDHQQIRRDGSRRSRNVSGSSRGRRRDTVYSGSYAEEVE